MSTAQLIGLLVIIMVIAVILLVVRTVQGRKVEHDRVKAKELREEGDRTRLQAREHEANAAEADARARQARVEADKLEREAQSRAQAAHESQARADEHHQRADELDPEIDGTRNTRDTPAENEEPRRGEYRH